jgi:DNA repair ATPase RecN
MEKLSEGASKEIIKALESVITEFNDNLKDQFGENFKQLNEACKELVQWQDNYKNQIEGHGKAISAAIESLETTKESLSKIAERNSEFKEFTVSIKDHLSSSTKMLDENLSVSKTLSESLATLNTSAEKFIQLPEDIEKLHQSFEKHLQNSGEIIETTNSKLEAHIEKAGDSMGNVRKEMEAATENLNNALISLTKQFGENYQVFLSSLEKLMINSNQ